MANDLQILKITDEHLNLCVFLSHIFTVVSLNSLTAQVGESITFHCSHLLADGNIKYLCRDSCVDKNIIIQSKTQENPTHKGRYTINDKGSDFTVTIADLRLSDSGTYICAIERLLIDTYSYVTLHVIEDPLVYIGAGLGALVLIFTLVLFIFIKLRKEKRRSSTVVDAQTAIVGHRGQQLDIRCPYKSGYETNVKYFCKGKCNFQNKNIKVKSGSPATDTRFSLTDNKTSRVFTVTITDLRTEDEGQYWCAVRRFLTVDVYSGILLLVKQDERMTEVPPISLFSITITHVSSAPLTHQPLLTQTPPPDSGLLVIIIITAGGLVLLLICAVLLIVAARKKKTCGLVSFSAAVLQVTGRIGEENAYETGNPADVTNSHRVQSDDGSSANEFHRPANTAAVDTNLDYINAAAAVTNVNPDQIYTELDASRHSNIYQRLTADSLQEVSIYNRIDQMTD
ncbi:uncharacterized protein [Garra rufa]|uniref:uncharacterized protein n=1 Tax=Garra rufa TaxID=137080 RepID=UPI003CCEA3D4